MKKILRKAKELFTSMFLVDSKCEIKLCDIIDSITNVYDKNPFGLEYEITDKTIKVTKSVKNVYIDSYTLNVYKKFSTLSYCKKDDFMDFILFINKDLTHNDFHMIMLSLFNLKHFDAKTTIYDNENYTIKYFINKDSKPSVKIINKNIECESTIEFKSLYRVENMVKFIVNNI